MNTVHVRLIGTRDECMTVIALLSQLGPIEVTANKPARTGGTRIYAEIRTRLRKS